MELGPSHTPKTFTHRRIGAFVLSLVLVLSSIHIVAPPKKADALFGDWALVIKEYGLDAAVNVIAKRMLQMITRDTVNWINSGFQGNPGFITNPQRFALEISDAAFNEFLTDDALNALCSPFRIDLRIALRDDYLYGPTYRCTIEDVVGNVEDFYSDFANGGWGAWFTMTQQRSNMPLGAYLDAQGDLYSRIGNSQTEWNKKLDWGQGLLAWDECTDPTEIEYYEIDKATGNSTKRSRKKTPQECPSQLVTTHTPGSVIGDQLSKVFGSGVDKLSAADEINEIVGALLTQFTLQLFNSSKGLFGLSGKIETNNLRTVGQVNFDDILDPEDPEAADYCGSFRDGMLPTATLDVRGPSATFTSNRRDVTINAGDTLTFSWCAANANLFGSTIAVRNDLSAGCSESGSSSFVAQNAFGKSDYTFDNSGCAYEITYGAQNSAFEDVLTGDLTTERAESRIIVRVGTTAPPATGGQCTISTVTAANLNLAVQKLTGEVTGTVTAITDPNSGVGRITISSINGFVTLTPVSPSSATDALKAEVANQIGCGGASNLTFMAFQVSDANQLPPEMLSRLGNERPTQILVVVGS